jgi:histidine triad (HIT) family protein
MADDCLFCKIVAREVPADIVFEDDVAIAIRDINPQAPEHVLVIPREHIVDLRELGARPDVAAPYITTIGTVADKIGADTFRTVFNTGAAVGQSVFHVHAHLLAGRPFSWPPG